jgi:serine/threonine-protein kinase
MDTTCAGLKASPRPQDEPPPTVRFTANIPSTVTPRDASASTSEADFSLHVPGDSWEVGAYPATVSGTDPNPARSDRRGGSESGSGSDEKSFWTSSAGAGTRGAGATSGGRMIVAGYEILGELGRGGMGVVYKANQLGLNRTVALKMVLTGAHAGTDQLARFMTEAQAVAHLLHPNIVQIYEVGDAGGLPFFSLEFVPCGTLSEKMGGKPLPDREAAQILEVIARAVHYAHQNQIIHRDLKPGNILLTPDGAPKIADFGLAKRIDLEGEGSQTRSGSIMGSPTYMAPEQATGDVARIGPHTDVYALGSMLYEMMSGRPPFLSARVLDVLEQVRSQDPVPPSRLRPKVSADLETVCLKCLQKDSKKRYESAEALADDLRRFLDGKPILARPVSSFERARSWCRRNPRVAALLAVVALLLTLLTAGSTAAAVLIARKQAETEQQRRAAVAARLVAEQKGLEAEQARRKADENAEIATRNAKVANEQSNLAVQTLYNLVRNIQLRIRNEGTQQKLRQDLLQNALQGLTKVVDSASNSTLITRTRIVAAQQMGDIERDLGRTEKALEHYLTCRRFIEVMAKDDPNDEIVLWNRAAINRKLGDVNLELLGDTTAARDAYRQALEWRLRLTTMTLSAHQKGEGPSPEMVRKALGEDYVKLSDVALLSGDPETAWSLYQKDLELGTKRTYATPGDYAAALRSGQLQADRVTFSQLYKVADVSFHLGDRESSRALLDKMLAQAQNPLQRAGAYLAFGDFAIRTGDPQTALDEYGKARELYDRIGRTETEGARNPSNLATTFYRLGTARLALGDRGAALEDYRRGLEHRKALAGGDPNNAVKQISLMLALARCGRHGEAAVIARKLRERAAEDPGMLFYAACGFALCAGALDGPAADGDTPDAPEARRRYRDQAIEALERAIGHGYRDAVALETDPDLAPIRRDPAFTTLLGRLRPARNPNPVEG